MATQNFSYLNITVNTKTGLSTAQQAENIALYGTNPANILFDEANKMIYVKGSPYCGKDWTSEISGIKTRLSTAETSINQIKAFLTGTASTIGGTFASNKYSIALTGLPTSGADKVNKTVKDYVNTLVSKVTTLETGMSNLQGSTVSSITTNDTSTLQLLTSAVGAITLNGTNLLVGNSATGQGETSPYYNSTISGAIHNIVDSINDLQSGTGGTSLLDALNAIRDIKEELEWDESAPSVLNSIIDNLRRLKTNSVEYKGIKSQVMGATGSERWLQHLTTDIPTNEAPISLQSAINNIAFVVNANALSQSYLMSRFRDSSISAYNTFQSISLDWLNSQSCARFCTTLNLRLGFDDSNCSTYITKPTDISEVLHYSDIYNIPSAYEVHKHIIDMSMSYYETGIPYNITDVTYTWWGEEYYDSLRNTYLKVDDGIDQSIVNDGGKLKLSSSLLYNNIYEHDNEVKTNAYNYVDIKINQVITWTELT